MTPAFSCVIGVHEYDVAVPYDAANEVRPTSRAGGCEMQQLVGQRRTEGSLRRCPEVIAKR
jgi:hypothetical protein